MRALLPRSVGLAALLFLGGCGSEQADWQDYFKLMRQSISGSFAKQGVTRSQAAAIPYSTLGYRLDGSAEAMLILATDTNGDLLWTSANHVVLLTRGGRIIRSVGLTHDLAGTAARGASALPPLSDALRAPYQSSRTLDLPDIGSYGVTLNCVTTARGSQTISIIGTTLRTTRVDETCRSAKPRWSFTDNYWIDADSGFVWHSVQHLHPAGTTIQVEILRPPG